MKSWDSRGRATALWERHHQHLLPCQARPRCGMPALTVLLLPLYSVMLFPAPPSTNVSGHPVPPPLPCSSQHRQRLPLQLHRVLRLSLVQGRF